MEFLFAPFTMKRFSFLVASVFFVYILLFIFHQSNAFWLVWSAFLMSQITLGDTLQERINLICLTGLMASLAACLVLLSLKFILISALLLFLITMICSWWAKEYSQYFLPAFIINLFAVLAFTHDFAPSASEVIKFILMGTLLIVFLQLFFVKNYQKHKMQVWLALTISHLRHLNQHIFNCLLSEDYQTDQYLYERRIHIEKANYLVSLSELRCLGLKMHKNKPYLSRNLRHITLEIDKMYDLIMAYAQIRRRVSDHSTFLLCERELNAINYSINEMFLHFIKMIKYPRLEYQSFLSSQLDQLEANFNLVLKVAGREPLVFVLFIESLKIFKSSTDQFKNTLISFNHF